jgi:hypothetical protein
MSARAPIRTLEFDIKGRLAEPNAFPVEDSARIRQSRSAPGACRRIPAYLWPLHPSTARELTSRTSAEMGSSDS